MMSWRVVGLCFLICLACLGTVVESVVFARTILAKLRLLQIADVLRDTRRLLRSLFARVFRSDGEKQRADLIESEVWKLYQSQRHKRCRSLAPKLSFGLTICVLYYVYTLLTQHANNSEFLENLAQEELTGGSLIPLICGLWVSILVRKVSANRGLKFVDIVVGVLVLRSIQVISFTEPADIPVTKCVHIIMRVCYCVICGNARWIAVLNVCYAVGTCSLTHSSIQYYSAQVTPEGFVYVLLRESLVAVGVTVLAFIVEDGWYAHARAMLEENIACGNESTIRSLLVVLCDAVVRVGPAPDLRILEASPQLSTVLLRDSLLDSRLLDLVDGEDRVRLVDRFGDDDGNSATKTPGLLHVGMIDGTGSRVSVRLFHATFTEFCGARGMLVGIQGGSEIECHADRPSVPCLWPIDERLESASVDHFTDMSGLGRQNLVVNFDCIDPQSGILQWNGAFNSIVGGCCVGQSLLQWIVDRRYFRSFIEERVNEAISCRRTSHQFEIGLVWLSFQEGPSASMECLATCSIEIPELPVILWDDEDDEQEDLSSEQEVQTQQEHEKKFLAGQTTCERVECREEFADDQYGEGRDCRTTVAKATFCVLAFQRKKRPRSMGNRRGVPESASQSQPSLPPGTAIQL